jgi:hypothetical protein
VFLQGAHTHTKYSDKRFLLSVGAKRCSLSSLIFKAPKSSLWLLFFYPFHNYSKAVVGADALMPTSVPNSLSESVLSELVPDYGASPSLSQSSPATFTSSKVAPLLFRRLSHMLLMV